MTKIKVSSLICRDVLLGLNPVLEGCQLRILPRDSLGKYKIITTDGTGRTLISIYDESSSVGAIWVGVADREQKGLPPLLEVLSGRSTAAVSKWTSRLHEFDEIDRQSVPPKPHRPFAKVFLRTTPGTERFANALLDFIKSANLPAATPISARILQEIRARQGQQDFRNRLLSAYGGACAITGCKAEPALEAAHIRPYAEYECHETDNGLVLRADVHTLFDLFLISVDPATRTIMVHPGIQSDYGHLQGRALTLPTDAGLSPNPAYLAEHNEKFMERLSLPPKCLTHIPRPAS